MSDPKIEKLFAEVFRKTQEGRLKWKETAKPSVFVAAVGGQFAVEIESIRYVGPSESCVVFSVRDYDDRELISVRSDNDSSVSVGLHQLYELARKSAFQVDHKVDQLLEALGRLA